MRQCYFQYLIGAYRSAPPASLPITTVHAPALFVAIAFKNESFLSLKNLFSDVSAICALAFPLRPAGGGCEEVFLRLLRPNELGTRLVSDLNATLMLFKTPITAGKQGYNASSLYLDTDYHQMFGDVLAAIRRMGPRQVLSLPNLGYQHSRNLTYDAADRPCYRH